MNKYWVVWLVVLVLSGCSAKGERIPFQVYELRRDCVACVSGKTEKWGFIPYRYFRKGEHITYAEFRPSEDFNIEREQAALCYGIALDTIKSGGTHFMRLDAKEYGNWKTVRSAPSIDISMTDYGGGYVRGSGTVSGGGERQVNMDGPWAPSAYYKVGTPKCGEGDYCNTKHKFNVENCLYSGEELRKEVEENHGSLNCVMKHNPMLIAHEVYWDYRSCYGNGWHSAEDAIRLYGPMVRQK